MTYDRAIEVACAISEARAIASHRLTSSPPQGRGDGGRIASVPGRGSGRRSARLEQVGAALEDGLSLVGGDLVLPALRTFGDVVCRLLGVAVRTRRLDRGPGVL